MGIRNKAARIANREKLLKKLAALPEEAKKEIRTAIENSAIVITKSQRSLVPTKTGELKKSIKYTFGNFIRANSGTIGSTTKGDKDLTCTISAGSFKAFYARWVEFGTTKSQASPYFFPPYRANKRSTKRNISAAITRSAKKVAKSGS